METNLNPTPSRLPFLIFGILAGLAIAGFLWFFFGNKTSGNQDTSDNSSRVLTLEITTPKENLATSRDNITLRGTTASPGVITITSSSETKTIQNTDTNFSTTVKLVEGKNVISVTAFDPKTGSSQTQIREVLYLNEDLGSL